MATLSHSTTVEELIRRWPAAIAVFQKRRMACVGCPMARFDTIADSARNYGIELVVLVRELENQMDSQAEGETDRC